VELIAGWETSCRDVIEVFVFNEIRYLIFLFPFRICFHDPSLRSFVSGFTEYLDVELLGEIL